MPEQPRLLPRSAWLGLGFVSSLAGLAVLVSVIQSGHRQPAALPVLGPVADFTLTNQDGKITTLADLTNHVWLADIIFTRCAGPCPRLTMQMRSLQDKIPAGGSTRFVTLTTDPDYDSPEIMKRVGTHYGADFNRWTFLTGTKTEIAGLAAGSLKLSAQPVKPEDQKDAADLFIHTTIFVIVDKHAQLRGFFETGGDGVDWTNDVEPRIIATAGQLESEP
jgi:protein SCO1/2